jgi:cleavage and polyadenylation specificity factor subunit 3
MFHFVLSNHSFVVTFFILQDVSLLCCSFHLDHCGALPWFLQKTSFKGRCFMTHATKAIYRWLLSDYIKVR